MEVVGRRARLEGPLLGGCWSPKSDYAALRAAVWKFLATEGGLRSPKGCYLRMFAAEGCLRETCGRLLHTLIFSAPGAGS